MNVEKTVFVSYRRRDIYVARTVYQDLTAHGYDCFLDYESIDAGSFERIIFNQIAARAHFIVILTPEALERCVEPRDWLRREIERAVDLKRNIIPVMVEGFSFRKVEKFLVTEKLKLLSQYNALDVPSSYIGEAMERLRMRFLSKPLDVILHPTPPEDRAAVVKAQANEAKQPTPPTIVNTTDYDALINSWNEADSHIMQLAEYLSGRGAQRLLKGDFSGAIDDLENAYQIDNWGVYRRELGEAHRIRGDARKESGELDGAIADYEKAVMWNSDDVQAKNSLHELKQTRGKR